MQCIAIILMKNIRYVLSNELSSPKLKQTMIFLELDSFFKTS
ncbi:MAG: hypothetical protein ACRCVW_02295 [Brevinema sp.]